MGRQPPRPKRYTVAVPAAPLVACPPLVLLHGFACHPEMFDPLLAQMTACPGGVLRPLLPGHGLHPVMPSLTSFLDIAGFVADTLPASYHLAGYSLGGRLALALAIARPERCRTLTLISAACGIDDDVARRSRTNWDEAQACRIEAEGVSCFMDHWAQLPLFATQQRLSPTQRALIRRQRCQHTGPGLAWAMRRLGQGNMPPLSHELAQLKLPVTLISGALDGLYTQRASALSARWPQLHHRTIEDAGHNLVVEEPHAVAAILTEVMSN